MNQEKMEDRIDQAVWKEDKELFLIETFLPVLAITRHEAANLLEKMEEVLGYLIKIGNGTDKAALGRRLAIWLLDRADGEDYWKWLQTEIEDL